MPELKVTFTLSAKDVAHLRRILRQASAAAKGQSAEQILRGAREMAKAVREAKPPDYVVERVEKLEAFAAMAEDKAWAPPQAVHRRVLTALAYFTYPQDLIPDPVPGLGYLDDAIMIELVAQDLRHELRGHQQFQRYRDSAVQRPWTPSGEQALVKKLVTKRRELRGKIDLWLAKELEQAEQSGKGIFRW